MNGVVKRDFVRRLSRNLTNMELGLSNAEEYAYYDAASYDHYDDDYDEGPPSYADRAEKRKRGGKPANYDCIRQRNRALGVVRDTNGRIETTTTTIGTNGTTPPMLQGKPKRRKAAPSLGRTAIPSCLDTEPHRIESPYFPRGQRAMCRHGSKCFRRDPNHWQQFYHPASRREEKYDDDDDDDDVIFLFEKQARRRPRSNRSLGKEAATQYPATGMLDSTTTSISDWRKGPGDDDDEDGGGGGGAWSAVGVGLGQSSFEVKQLRDQADDIPREDGTMYDDDPNPFSAKWQDLEFNKQKILENNPDYQFITLLSGFTNTPVVRLYDEARLEDIVVRRLDVQRQMRRIRDLEEMRLKRVPQLEQEAARLQSTLERAEGSLRLLERNRDSIRAAKRIMRRAREAREIITEADESEATLRTAKQLVMGFTKHAGDAAWIDKITDPSFLNKVFQQIQRCARFLIPLGQFRTEAIVRPGTPRTKIDVVETVQETIMSDPSVSDMAVARTAFVCMAYLVALILDSREFQEGEEDSPRFRSSVEPTAAPGASRPPMTAMELWKSIVLGRTDRSTGVLLVADPKPPPDLAQPGAEDLRTVMEDLRSIWIYWSPLPSAAKRSRVSGQQANLDTLNLMNQVFHQMLEDFGARARRASEDLIEIQEGIRDTASAIEDLTRRRDPLPTTLSAWEDALRTWVEGVEAGAQLSETQRRVMFERLQKLTTTLREMEIITPPRVKYQRRREWALRPEHSGRVPLDSTVVSGIQAAVDTMTDVGRVLHGARSDHMRNVLTAGVDNLQRDRLSRGAFAKLVASRMAMQQEMFPTRWTRKEHLHRIRLQTASALRSLTNLRWTGSKFVDRTRDTLALERALMTRIFSRWPPAWRQPDVQGNLM